MKQGGLQAIDRMAAGKKRLPVFLSLLAFPAVAWHRAVVETMRLFDKDAFTYIPLVLMLCAAFFYLCWPQVRKLAAFSVAGGLPFFVLAAALALGAHLRSRAMPGDLLLSLRILAVVLCWVGTFILCFGGKAARAALFPLVFLFAAVPLPAAVLTWIVSQLQTWSALSAMALYRLAGVPAFRDGVYLSLPGLTIEVAKECSSIRSSSMLLVTAIGIAQMLLLSPWRRSIVILSAVPLSVAKNGLRIFTISMLSVYVDPTYMTGKFHHQGGVVFFAIALALMFLLLWWLRRGENRSQPEVVPGGPDAAPGTELRPKG